MMTSINQYTNKINLPSKIKYYNFLNFNNYKQKTQLELNLIKKGS
jgi:hypothetical protein